ncbi:MULTISPECIES: mercuric reductase [unclassified Lysobacter]
MSTMQTPSVNERDRLDNLRPPDWRNPPPATRYDLVVIGAGPAGLVAAQEAAGLGVRVALVEREMLGGNCVNTGCVPSKAMLRTSRVYAQMHEATRYGAQVPPEMPVDFAALMERMRGVRARISRADSAHRLAHAGIDVFFGQARFRGNDSVEVAGATLRFRKALIATGAHALIPDIPGLATAGYLTNHDAFEITELPRRLLVIGGGPLGCELAQAFSRFGSRTTIAQHWPLFLPREERDAAQVLSSVLARDGLEIRLNTRAVRVRVEAGRKLIDLVSDDFESTVEADAILTATGRAPNVEGLELEAAGVQYDPDRGIHVDDFLQTTNPLVYAAGDVCLEHKFTNVAEASGRIALHNGLFDAGEKLSGLVIPWCTYTDPEIAHVGLHVRHARELGIPVTTFTVPMHDVDRAITDNEEVGFVKIHVRDGSDLIIGATIVARHAGEMISEITLAMVAGIGLGTLSQVIHAYPTQADAIRKAAQAYVAGLATTSTRRQS